MPEQAWSLASWPKVEKLSRNRRFAVDKRRQQMRHITVLTELVSQPDLINPAPDRLQYPARKETPLLFFFFFPPSYFVVGEGPGHETITE